MSTIHNSALPSFGSVSSAAFNLSRSLGPPASTPPINFSPVVEINTDAPMATCFARAAWLTFAHDSICWVKSGINSVSPGAPATTRTVACSTPASAANNAALAEATSEAKVKRRILTAFLSSGAGPTR